MLSVASILPIPSGMIDSLCHCVFAGIPCAIASNEIPLSLSWLQMFHLSNLPSVYEMYLL